MTKPCCRKAKVASTLRFAGGLHIVGRIVVEAELDTANAARRLRRDITDLYGHSTEVLVMAAGELRKAAAMSCAWSRTARPWPTRRGSSTPRGRPVRGLPPKVVSAAACDAEAAWRGVPRPRLADRAGPVVRHGGHLPGAEAAPWPWSAQPGRLGIQAKAREVRGVGRVVLRDGDAIEAMLTRLGAHDAVLAWEERRMRREVRATASRLANFDDANLRPLGPRRNGAARPEVQRALEILGEDVPDHLREAGSCASSTSRPRSRLGQLAQPPMTKDAVAGRIRRLLAMADKHSPTSASRAPTPTSPPT